MRFHHRHEGPRHGHRDHWPFWRHAPFGMLGFGNERRARRGDVKFIILAAIAEKPMHGYDIIQSLEQQHEGRYRPSPGSIYPTLQLLEEGGFLTSEQRDGKRVYSITDAGRALLAERGAHPDDFDEGESGERSALRDSARRLIAAVRQGAMNENRESREQVRRIVDEARKKIYKVLAEED